MSKSFDKFSKRAKLPRASKPVINKITSMIQNGDLKPGDRLPPQDVLADHLGVSRTTLREALKELSFRGLIICKHGIGTFISSGLVSDLEMVEARKYVEKVQVIMLPISNHCQYKKAIETCQFYGEICNYT